MSKVGLLAQGLYVAIRAGLEPATLQTKGDESTIEAPRPTNCQYPDRMLEQNRMEYGFNNVRVKFRMKRLRPKSAERNRHGDA